MNNWRDFRLAFVMLIVLLFGWLLINVVSELPSGHHQQDHSITITVKSH